MAERSTQLDGWLSELERQDMLRSEASAAPVYAVKHEVIGGVAYHSLLPDRRIELHRAAAAAIEELAGDREDEHYAELSRHWECAEHWVKAMHYGELAGDQAAQIDANGEARDLFARALRAAQRLRQPPDAERLVALLTKSAHVAGALGAHEDAIGHCTRALAVAREIGDRRAELDVLAGLGEVYDRCHRPEEAHSYRDQALAMAEELDERGIQAACLASRATSIATWQGPTAEARRAARSALELAEQVNDPPLRARALVVLGSVLQWRADYDACQQYLQEGAALAERVHRGALLGQALFHLGHALRSRGRYQQALRWYADGHDHAEHVNDKFWIARAPGIAASVYLDLYDADTAIRLCLESDELAQRLVPGMAEPRGHCLVTLALAHLRRGAQGPAEAFLRRASDLLERDGTARWRWNVPLLRARAEVALAGGRLDEAWEFATQSRQLATQADARKHVAHAQLVLGEIAAAQDRLPDAAQLLRGALSLAEHIQAARPLWLSGSALGQILAHMEREREAEAYLTQAAQIIETIAAELGDPALRASFLAADTVAEVYQRLGHRPLPAVGRAAS
jgi:tetratricopeptide (TPR) repeat protein